MPFEARGAHSAVLRTHCRVPTRLIAPFWYTGRGITGRGLYGTKVLLLWRGLD